MHEAPVVVLAGGGTGGHLYPALAIADALRERRPDAHVVFVGAQRGLEARVLPARGEDHHLLPVHGIDRSRPLESWRAIVGLFVALLRVVRVFRRRRPEVVVVTGGYAGAPAGIVAGLSGIPLVLQEQNAEPGLVTRLLTRWATRVHVAYPEAIERLGADARARLTGNPVRARAVRSPERARAELGIPRAVPLVVVIGGSQGSLALNRVIGEVLRGIANGVLHRPEGLHLLWVTGPSHVDAARSVMTEYESPAWVHPVGYVDDLPSALSAADLAVSRSGAMSTAELLDCGLPAVLVPFPGAAAGHQMHNARALERAGAAVVAPQAELTGESLWAEIERLLDSPGLLAKMRQAALALAHPTAAADIATDLETFLPAPRRAA
ncbi:MAG TPA: undecaprenyldiphospho-muramoylpentapeptide beta-N-acetylglucosaminyltransferase [Longimicrobiales bacterium]|nr:undecaprenyldiphospho-muramoylpentapeptide beta-N-acetylglucosaminyltransferase [Longimicrobiales bacterium]